MINKVHDFSTQLLIHNKELSETSDTPWQQTKSNIDFEAPQPKFGWSPVDVIKSTFENTTQFHQTPASTQLKKQCCSPHPACDVQCRQEPLATDTVHSDTPAIDDGSKVAQTFVGAESCVVNVLVQRQHLSLSTGCEM